MTIARDEIFGPVLSVLTYTSEEEAVRIANAVDYGLTASVWTSDLAPRTGSPRAGRRVRVGERRVPALPGDAVRRGQVLRRRPRGVTGGTAQLHPAEVRQRVPRLMADVPAAARSGAAETVAALASAGVDHVFGLPGTTIMDILDALAQQDAIRYITVRHEQVAAFMADGYARASGTVGVCLASRGPGAANLAIGVHNAHAESIPVLAVVGQVGDDIAARHAFEETDLLTMFAPMTKWAVEVHDSGRIRELATRAVRAAAGGRPGPVLLSLPLDVQQRQSTPGADTVGHQGLAAGGRIYRPAADPQAAEHVARLLAAAQRPVLIAGGGAAGERAVAAVTALAAAAALPAVTTWLRKSQFPNDDEHYAGVLGYGAHAAAEAAVREADLVLALGCRFAEFTTRRWTLVPASAAVVQVDIDPDEIGRTIPVTVGLPADASLASEAIVAAVEAQPGSPLQQARYRELRARYRELHARYERGERAACGPAVRAAGTVRRPGSRAAGRGGPAPGPAGPGCAHVRPVDRPLPADPRAGQLLRRGGRQHGLGVARPPWASRPPARTGGSSRCSGTAASGWWPRTWRPRSGSSCRWCAWW